MEAQYFVYTRGHDMANDYKLMFSPSNEFCPDGVRKYFLKQVRGVINIEQYQEGSLYSPRWLFSRYNGFSLWGMGIMNSELCETTNSDYTGRAVRGFFGILLKNDTYAELPFDISFWKKFYTNYVSPLWTVGKEEFKQKGIIVEESFEQYNCITPNNESVCLLNTQLNKTVIWGNLSEKEMFSTAMALTDDISCVSNLGEREHAYNHEYCYFNAIVNGITETESKIYLEKKENEKKGGTKGIQKDGEDKVVKPKKVLRPKSMLIIVCMLIIILLIVVLCAKRIQKSEHSTSGKKEVNQTELVLPSSTLDSVKK